jgi:hypothetical protein
MYDIEFSVTFYAAYTSQRSYFVTAVITYNAILRTTLSFLLMHYTSWLYVHHHTNDLYIEMLHTLYKYMYYLANRTSDMLDLTSANHGRIKPCKNKC